MILELVKIRLRSLLFAMSGKSKSGDKSKQSVVKIALFAVLYLYLIAVLLFVSIGAALLFGKALVPLGLGEIYLAFFALVTFSVIFLISIFETKSELFECRDNELLLSMPISEGAIVLSRIATVLFCNYIISFMFMLPASIVYASLSGNVTGLIGGVIAALVIPLPATALSSAVGYLVALIAKRTKRNTLVSVIASLAFLFIYFYAYGAIMSGIGGEEADISGVILGFADKLSPISVIGRALFLKPLEFTVFILVSLLVSAAAYLLISHFYTRIITDNGGTRRTVYKEKRVGQRSPVSALLVKELHRMASSSVYLLNAGLGALLRVLVGIVLIVKRDAIGELVIILSEELSVSASALASLAATLAVVMLSFMDMFSASAVSLEGKSLWVIRSMPIAARDVLIAKTLAHLTVCAPATLISSVLILIALGAPPSAVPLAIITPLIVAALFAVFGTVINVAFPKLEFDNEAQPVKQSLSTFIVMFSQMLYGVALIFGAIFLSTLIGVGWALFLVMLFNLLLLSVLSVIMLTASSARFEKL